MRETPRRAAPWSTAEAPVYSGSFPNGREADVAIVGAGLTGLAASVMLARNGHRVTVLERGRVGDGVTGQSTGKVTALQEFTYHQLEERHGFEVTQRYAEGTVDAITWLTSLINSERIECSLEPRTAVSAVRDWRLEDLVDREAAAASRAGLVVGTVTSAPGVPFRTCGAVTLERQFQLDPRALVSGMARVASRLGVEIFEHSVVGRLGTDGGLRTLELQDGRSLRASRVILATHVPSPNRGLVSTTYVQSRSAAVAVRPAESVELPMISVQGRGSVSSLRDFGDLVIAIGAHHTAGKQPIGDPHERLGRELSAWFPAAARTHEWSAQDAELDDMLPLVGQVSPRDDRVLTATGFRKWGLSSAVAAARCLVALIDGGSHAWEPIANPWSRFRRLDLDADRRYFGRQLQVAGELVTGRLGSRTQAAREGRSARIEGPPWHRVATFTEAGGNSFSFRAECTHIGCEVRWNDYAESWDCPCHGSRFDARTGEVLEGPAVSPLQPEQGRTQPGSVSPPIGARTSPL